MTKTERYDGIKAGIWYTVGNIIVKAIPFLSLPLFTRLLSTDDFGIYNTYLSYENILSVLLGFGMAQTVKIARLDFKDIFEKYVSSILETVLLIGGLVLAVANIAFKIEDFGSYLNWIDRPILNMLIINSIATALYGILGSKYVILGKYKENIVMSLMMATLNVGISIFLCYFFLSGNRALARITGTAIGTGCVGLYVILKQRNSAPLRMDKAFNRFAFRYGLPLIPHQLSVSLFSQCDKIMIQAMCGNSVAGIYGLAVNVMLVLSVLVNSFDNAWTPWFFNGLSAKAYNNLREKNGQIVIFFIYLYCGFVLVSPDVVHIFAQKSYWDAVYALLPLAVSSYINFIYLFSVGVEYFYKKTGLISLATITCVVANVGLNYLFIMRWGYIAAAYSTCITKFMLFVIHYFASGRVLAERIVNTGYLIIGLIVVCVMATFSGFMVNNILARYLVVIFITILVFFYFKKNGTLKVIYNRFRKQQ